MVTMKYRREIDGLRALAIIPVILFHAGFTMFSGGYVGVDVFFVISGYLITSIIISDMQAGTFSLINFYERRARRILPALFVVMFVCLPFAWCWLFPNDMKDFSNSIRYVSVFLSNIFFYKSSGYFDTVAALKPLLHTWSLAVEEQYYLLFPILILTLWRYARKLIPYALIVFAVISLIYMQYIVGVNPNAAFFLLPSRLWELMIGSILAYISIYIDVSLKGSQSASLVGLILILYAVFFFNNNTPFSSLYTLIPTIGAALIIAFATPNTFAGKLLGSRLFVGVGLISYSTYLWHQPVLAFARHRSIDEPTTIVLVMLIGMTLVLAYFSWRFVETPFRDKVAFSRNTVFKFAACGIALFITFSLAGRFTQGYFFRNKLSDSFNDADYRLRVNVGLNSDCVNGFTLSGKCRTNESPEVLVWGDSYAMHLMQGFLTSKPDIKIIQMTKSVCGPILGIAPISKEHPKLWGESCIKNNDEVFDWVKAHKSLKYVVLASPFGQYVNPNSKILFRDGTTALGEDVAFDYFRNTLIQLKENGIKPIIFSPPPFNGKDIGNCIVKTKKFSQPIDRCNFYLNQSDERQASVIKLLKKIDLEYKVIWLSDGICFNGKCEAIIHDSFIYRDSGHLSYEGSALIGDNMNFYEKITGVIPR